MKKEYIVEAREIHCVKYLVFAESPEDAFLVYEDGETQLLDSEYSSTLDGTTVLSEDGKILLKE